MIKLAVYLADLVVGYINNGNKKVRKLGVNLGRKKDSTYLGMSILFFLGYRCIFLASGFYGSQLILCGLMSVVGVLIEIKAHLGFLLGWADQLFYHEDRGYLQPDHDLVAAA